MPIEVTDHTAVEREARRAGLLAQTRRETLRTITLPVGRPRRRIEVVRVSERPPQPPGEGVGCAAAGVRYELAGDLELFGVDEPWDTVPIPDATDATEACRLGEEMVRRRWVRECEG